MRSSLLIGFLLLSAVAALNSTDHCFLPPVHGLCRAAKHRFYYDPSAGECKEFRYGGCGGNANNFVEIETCEASCKGVKPAQ